MTEFEIHWTVCPTNFNQRQVLFVESASASDACAIAKDHIKRTRGCAWFVIEKVARVEPLPAGQVVYR
jgi:hypothetical protein